jgi:hypothetical protein
MRSSCFSALTGKVSGDGESSGVSKWPLTLSIEAPELGDWRERVEGDEFRELGVSAVLELARRDKFGIAGNSERHSEPEETSPLLGPVGKDKSSVVASVSGIAEDSEVDATSSLLETP